MCSIGGIGYYPSAFYTTRKGLCAFDKIFPIKTLEAYYQAIQYVISKFSFLSSTQTFNRLTSRSNEVYDFLKIIKTNIASTCTNHQCVMDIDAYLVLA